MSAARFGNFHLGLMLAMAFAVSMRPTPSLAYTAEEQQACSGDAFRLCSSEIPDVDRVTACMVRNKAQLSPGCRVYFRPDPEPSAAASDGEPESIKPVTAHKSVGAKPRKHKRPGRPAAT
jgi:hypothetical protein